MTPRIHALEFDMDDRPIEVAICIVAYNSAADLPACLDALRAAPSAGLHTHIVVVDNNSNDESAAIVRRQYQDVELLESKVNLGFAGGNNLGWQHIQQHHPQVQYLALLNPDTQVTAGWLEPLIAHLEAHCHVGTVQPKLRLLTNHSPSDRLNTVGNRCHYLGFGFTVGYGETDRGQYDQVRSIDFASGAALVTRAALVRELGLFDEPMFMYLEDADLAWKQRLHGYDTQFVPGSVVFHRHHPQNTLDRHLYHLEKNRWWLILSYYKVGTLLLLAPALLLAELGVLGWALAHGVLKQKLRAYGWLGRRDTRQALARNRKRIQSQRRLDDRALTAEFAGRLDFYPLSGGLMQYAVNPLFSGYWAVARRLMRW